MTKRALPFVLLLLTLAPRTVLGQERGQIGLTMGYPASLGLIWHATDKLAIRPDVAVNHASTEVENEFLGDSSSRDAWSYNVGATGIFYMGRWDNVRSYVSPRFAYGRASAETGLSTPSTTSTVTATFSIGVQFSPARKFSVYGEAGYGLSRGSADLETPIGTTSHTSTNWGTRSGVGVILYFGR
jgi:hypothetical protein